MLSQAVPRQTVPREEPVEGPPSPSAGAGAEPSAGRKTVKGTFSRIVSNGGLLKMRPDFTGNVLETGY